MGCDMNLLSEHMRKLLIETILFKGPVSWVARLGVHVREVQLRYLFDDKKPTFLQAIGLRKFNY